MYCLVLFLTCTLYLKNNNKDNNKKTKSKPVKASVSGVLHLLSAHRHLGINQNDVSAEAKCRFRADSITSMVFMFCIGNIYPYGEKDLEFELEPSVLDIKSAGPREEQ